METHQCIPIGYWKGSGLSLALDLIAATLAGGRTSRMVGELPVETELSQVFMAISLDAFADKEALMKHIDETLRDMKTSLPVSEVVARNYLINERPDAIINIVDGTNIERNLYLSTQIMELGIPVDEGIWQKVLDM